MWTFVRVEGLEPTNNSSERAVRHGAMAIAAIAVLFATLATVKAQVVDPSELDHLKCYRINDSLQPTRYLADLRNQFGLEPGCVVMTPARVLCVETEKSIISSPAPPGGGPSGDPAGHFLCYFVSCRVNAAPSSVNIEDQFGRRTGKLDAGQSLLLLKGVGRVPHEGGQRFGGTSLPAEMLTAWLSEGLKDDPATLPAVKKAEVLPGSRVLKTPSRWQQLAVNVTFADGTARDMTRLTVFSSSDPSIADVNPNGLVEFKRSGEVAM